MIDAPTTTVTVAIIGGGFAGIGAAIRLRQLGIDDVIILERADDIGGTWRDNTYPGCACDIPSHLYSLSFEPKTDWSRLYSPQQEIWDYLLDVVDRHGLRERLMTGAEVTSAVFDESTATWRVTTADGREVVANILLTGIGGLRDPAYPDIPGRESFAGPQLHTARWDHTVDFAGKRVGVVGTGASAIQVIPELAKVAAEVVVFQRTPAWVTPRRDRAYSPLEKRLFATVPGPRKLHRAYIYARKEFRYVLFEHPRAMAIAEQVIRRHIRKQVPDPELAARLMPNYRMGCKRILVSDDYYPAMAQPHVDLVTERIDRVEPDRIVTADGGEHELDVIVWATGFDILIMLGTLDVTGVDGRDLRTCWDGTPSAHLGMTVPGFPNLFMLLGPNTGLGHNSVVIMIESQLNYVMDAIAKLREHDAAYVDVTPEALAAWEHEVVERTRTTVWAAGCDSWYLGEGGYNFTLWPGSTIEYRQRTRRFDVANYRVVRRDELPERVAAAAS